MHVYFQNTILFQIKYLNQNQNIPIDYFIIVFKMFYVILTLINKRLKLKRIKIVSNIFPDLQFYSKCNLIVLNYYKRDCCNVGVIVTTV